MKVKYTKNINKYTRGQTLRIHTQLDSDTSQHTHVFPLVDFHTYFGITLISVP